MFPKQFSAVAVASAALAFSIVPSCSAKTPATAFLQAVSDDSKTMSPPSEIALALASPTEYAGRHFNVEGRIAGFVTTDSGRTALVNVGIQSISVQVPASLSTDSWLTDNSNVRLLLAVHQRVSDGSSLTLVMSAPAAEVDLIDANRQQMAAYHAQALASRLSDLRQSGRTSRAWNSRFSRTEVQSTELAPMPLGNPITVLSPGALLVYPRYRAAIHGLNARLSDSDLDKITSSVLYYSDQKKLDPRLVIAMIIAESNFNLKSTSRTGAMGLGQLMPSTARGLGVRDPYDPIQNIGAAVHILRGHLDTYGGILNTGDVVPEDQIALIMSAYNAGPGAVRKYHGVPPFRETQRYVQKVTAIYHKLCGQG